jgi:hypothetical protein
MMMAGPYSGGESVMKVFVTYTHSKDVNQIVTKLMEYLEETLRDEGHMVFFDRFQIEADAEAAFFKKELSTAARDADALLILISPAWLRSYWCRWEFEEYIAARKENQDPCVLPIYWADTPALDNPADDKIAKRLREILSHNFQNGRLAKDELLNKIATLTVETLHPPGPGTSANRPYFPEQDRLKSERDAAALQAAGDPALRGAAPH